MQKGLPSISTLHLTLRSKEYASSQERVIMIFLQLWQFFESAVAGRQSKEIRARHAAMEHRLGVELALTAHGLFIIVDVYLCIWSAYSTKS